MGAAPKTKPVYTVATASEGFVLQANAAPMKTPAGKNFSVTTEKLAKAIAEEWRLQGDKINPATMPLTQLASTALDIASKDRVKIIDQLTAYISSELLCHTADHPDVLKEQQHKMWQPVLDWCALRFDALLQSGSGIMPIKQSPQAQQALKRAIESYDDFHLVGLRHAVDVSGSLILGLALIEKYLTTEQILQSAELDATFQMQQWGEDPDILKRQADVRRELDICARWFGFLD